MYFSEKGNTDIDEDLKYRQTKKPKVRKTVKKIYPYFIFLGIFLFGILLIIIASKM